MSLLAGYALHRHPEYALLTEIVASLAFLVGWTWWALRTSQARGKGIFTATGNSITPHLTPHGGIARPASSCFTDGVGDITRILEAVQHGESHAADDLLDLVYNELRRIAAVKMAGEAPGQTLQPTALVHEAWLKLGGDTQPAWQNRAHFFAAAAEAMRRILIERARSKARLRRGGAWQRVDIEHVTVAAEDPDDTVLAVHEALDKLAEQDPLKAQIVKLRYFVGMSHQEIADALGVAEVTVRRHWAFARSWLYAELKESR
jgi:RNA polymerase sigma factor (TIGR02999 family)